MRTLFVLSVLALAGCASAQARQEPGPVITRIAASEGVVLYEGKPNVVSVVAGACRTNDVMPNARPKSAPTAPMPSASTPRPLAYIPNACPVTAAHAGNAATVTAYPAGEKPLPPTQP